MALLLRPSMLDDLDWCRPSNGRRAKSPSAAASGSSWTPRRYRKISRGAKTCVYRIVQEALHNQVQHAAARHVKIAVEQQSDQLRLAIEDDGKGFDAQHERGMGLLGIQERVGYLGGRFDVESSAGKGTTLKITLPLVRKFA